MSAISSILTRLADLVKAAPSSTAQDAAPIGSRFAVIDMHAVRTAAGRAKAKVAGLAEGVRIYVGLPDVKNSGAARKSAAGIQLEIKPLVTLEMADTISDKANLDPWDLVEALAASVEGQPISPNATEVVARYCFHFEGAEFAAVEAQAGGKGGEARPGALLYVLTFSIMSSLPPLPPPTAS